MWRRGGYQSTVLERLGCLPFFPKTQHKRIWIQAVSVGEVQSVRTLVDGLVDRGFEIILTTTTSTGYRLAQQLYQDQVLYVGVFPLDFWLCSARVWDRFQPDQVLHVDSELWPEHLHQAKNRRIPVDICNARVSNRSFRRYQAIRPIARFLFQYVRWLFCASHVDMERFVALGADPARAVCVGNLKVDQPLPRQLSAEEKQAELVQIGLLKNKEDHACILLGSSTWEGEEALLLNVLEQQNNVRLILAPRHPERREAIHQLLKANAIPFHFRSWGKQAPIGTRIYVVDTMGELNFFTGLCDLVFIGKTLPPHRGGQSPVGAAGMGLPMVLGPETSNFQSLVASLLEMEGAWQRSDGPSIVQALLDLVHNPHAAMLLGQKAQLWYKMNQGATQRVMQYLLY